MNDVATAWNRASACYQSQQSISTQSVHYGPWAPLEDELGLLGDVAGKRILELGCGGGQCVIALSRQGALATGLDVSDAQLQFARHLAQQEGISATFVQGVMEDLTLFGSDQWDIIFSVYAFQYSANPALCLRESARVLRPGGSLVFSLDHPFRNCFFDEVDGDLTIYPSRSYFDCAPMKWLFGETGAAMRTYHHTIADWVTMLADAGLTLRRLVEPQPAVEMLDALWPHDSALAALRNIPQTMILVAMKTSQP